MVIVLPRPVASRLRRQLSSALGRTRSAFVWRSHSFTGSITTVNAAAKLLAAMRRTQLDWQISDLQSIARHHGLDWRHQKSSHCVFVRDDGRTLSVPAHRPIKPIYIRKFVELIDGA